jgi:pSer/pThr/pTyr-binding forkhead associated (FHA) protein
MKRGPTPGMIYELNDEIITIGRGSKNQIVIQDNEVSREHCRLIQLMADYEVVDLGSSNGTYVNGARVEGTRVLQPGFLIELGDSITFEYERPLLSDVTAEHHAGTREPAQPEPGNQAYLVLTHGPEPGHVYPLEGDKITIGRDLTNNVVILFPEVSRFHVHLLRDGDSYVIEDLASTNGTIVNGERVSEPRLLHPNDVILIGTMVRLRYTFNPDEVIPEVADDSYVASVQTQPTRKPIIEPAAPELDTSRTNAKLLKAKSKRTTTSRLGTGLEPGMLEDHILIAYAREQWEHIVAPLTIGLQDVGLKVWVDQYLIPGGDDWMEAIEQALFECWLLIVVVTPESINTPYVEMEYRYFFNREKPVIPLVSQDLKELPRELRNLKAVVYDEDDPRQAFQKLIFEILHINR